MNLIKTTLFALGLAGAAAVPAHAISISVATPGTGYGLENSRSNARIQFGSGEAFFYLDTSGPGGEAQSCELKIAIEGVSPASVSERINTAGDLFVRRYVPVAVSAVNTITLTNCRNATGAPVSGSSAVTLTVFQ